MAISDYSIRYNQAYENLGLASTQTIATLFDGMARHSPEGLWFKERAEEVGFKQLMPHRFSTPPAQPAFQKARC